MRHSIQAAVDSGRPPLELILNEPDRKRSKWDGILIKALYLYKSFEIEGYPIWVEESPDITFKAVPRVIRSLRAVEEAQERETKLGDKATKGKRFHAEVVLRSGAKWPTRSDWEARRRHGETVPEDGVKPRMIAEAEDRAKALVALDPDAQRIVAEFRERFKNHPGRIEG